MWRLGLVLCLTIAGLPGEVRRDIEYGRAGGVSLRLDAGVPEGAGPFPVVLIVHGGGWSGGDKAADHTALFQPLTDSKFVWFSVNYRLAPENRWPACYEDVKTALGWVRAHAAEYHGDPKRIAILGYSVGGQLASLVTVRSAPEERPQAVV